MKLTTLLFASALFLVVTQTTVEAYNPSINVPELPYAIYMADSDITTKAEYLGELIGDPHMYEFSIGADAKLSLTLTQLADEAVIPFSLITVKQNNQNAGVVEVGRLPAKEVSWSEVDESALGLDLVSSQVFEANITPGIYRVEVSTAENFGKYMLTIGEEKANPGYFSTLADIRLIQKFFGASIFALFLSSYVYYPIGIMLLLWLFFFTWKRRDMLTSIKHA